MTQYVRDESRSDAKSIEQTVEQVTGRSVAGVTVDGDGLKGVVLPEGETLTNQEIGDLEREFGITLRER